MERKGIYSIRSISNAKTDGNKNAEPASVCKRASAGWRRSGGHHRGKSTVFEYTASVSSVFKKNGDCLLYTSAVDQAARIAVLGIERELGKFVGRSAE